MVFLLPTLQMTTNYIKVVLKVSNVLIILENGANTMLQWFKDSRMKANSDKYCLLINENKESFHIKIGNKTVPRTKYQNSLAVKIKNI